MLSRFLRRGDGTDPESGREKDIVIEGQEEEAAEAISVLAQEGEKSLDKSMEEIRTAVKEAARDSLREIRMMEEGRCPSCGHKLDQFVFTSVCPSCGWFSSIHPEEGRSVITFVDGSTVTCGATYDTRDGSILGITDGVVRFKVPKDHVKYVEFAWTDEEVDRKRKRRVREQAGICSWCEGSLAEAEEEAIIIYAAFGAYQERYVLCSERCQAAFKKQYPVRIHKNCYERPCLNCDLCIKRYDGEDETVLKKLEEGVF